MENIESKSLYDVIGKNYDDTRHADPYILSTLIRLLNLPKKALILDVACGTGNYTIGLRKEGYNITGLDCSEVMLKRAREKDSFINWVHGIGDNMPFESAKFDGVICTFAIHHFYDLYATFSEFYRIMKNGNLVLLTCTHNQIRNYWLYRYFPEVLESMTEYMPDISIVIDYLCEAGFSIKTLEPYFITDDLEDCFLGCKKNNPELYLNEAFRNGMSIFSAKAKPEHINAGCTKLQEEITSGAFSSFIRQHKNLIGDYIFIKASKS